MGHISRKFARASRRGLRRMEQHQPRGAYHDSEKWYNMVLQVRRDRRAQMGLSGPVGINVARLLGIELPPEVPNEP
jgi:hypothetical protein